MLYKKRIGTLVAAAFGLLSVIYFCVAIVSAAAAPGRLPVLFQMPPEEDWQAPINLSPSGSGEAPQLLALYNGYLVFWRDSVGGVAYTQPEMNRR